MDPFLLRIYCSFSWALLLAVFTHVLVIIIIINYSTGKDPLVYNTQLINLTKKECERKEKPVQNKQTINNKINL